MFRDTDEVGVVIGGRYLLEQILGSGGMGVVYEAADLYLRRKVAVKTIHRILAADQTLVLRLLQEASLCNRLNHPNICEVFDRGTTEDGRPFFVMPLLRGEPLSTTIAREGRLEPWRATDIVVQLLDALEVAHSFNVVHRDLKPDNVYLCNDGERSDWVKLLDFGICKVLDAESTLTSTGRSPGTPAYMAPELLDSGKPVDCRADIYAAGIILYQALVGRRPFTGENFYGIIRRILDREFILPRLIDPTMSPSLEAVILRAMAKAPKDRYATAAQMRVALKAATSDMRNRPKPQAEVLVRPVIVVDQWSGNDSAYITITDIPAVAQFSSTNRWYR